MGDLLNLFLMLLSKVNQGYWSLTGDESLIKKEYCDIHWRVYKTCTHEVNYTVFCVEDGIEMFTSEFYNANLHQTVLLSNPFFANFSHYNVEPMVEALISRCDFNLIALDNSLHTNAHMFLDYPLTMLQVYNDSQRFAEVLNDALMLRLFSAKHVTALGFSLGAQLSGQVCRLLDEKCGHILAIDPAGPLFFPKVIPLIKDYPHLQLVSRADACEVVFVECNRWMMGTGFRSAHKNIVINNGLFQPTCFPGNLRCSHEFCNKLMMNAILNPGTCIASSTMKLLNLFTSITDKGENFTLKLPLDEGIDSCERDEKKVYYMTTADDRPECLGRNGSNGIGILNTLRHTFG